MKYCNYIIEMEKEAGIKISNPVKKIKNMTLGKKIGAGIGVASTGLAVGSAIGSGAKEMLTPIAEPNGMKTGFRNGTMSVNPSINKKASAEQDSLAVSKMKYLPAIATAATAGLVGVGVATGKLNKKIIIDESKKMGKKVSKAYNTGSKIITGANKMAKDNRKNEVLKAAFEEYKKTSGNTLIEFGDFKELQEAYENWKRVKNNNNVNFSDWVEKNGGKFVINKGKYKSDKKSFKQKADMVADAAIKGAALGTTTSIANFAVHEAGDEYFKKKDKDEVRQRFREDWNNNFTDNLVKGKRAKRGGNTGYKTPKQKVDNYNRRYSPNNNKNDRYNPKYIKKVASSPAGDFVNHADDMIGAASKKLKGKELFKDIVKNDVVKSGVTGVAYVGAPALAAVALNRDRNTFKKIENNKTEKMVMDMPESAMNKKASFKNKVINNAKKIKTDYIPENIGQEFARAGLRGLSMATPVALIANATNRNLRGNMEKLEDKNKQLKPVDKGNVRITVERRVDNV